jgi:peptidoglycan/xylan/chitin deacetylase (PgdA/CDA1 family)
MNKLKKIFILTILFVVCTGTAFIYGYDSDNTGNISNVETTTATKGTVAVSETTTKSISETTTTSIPETTTAKTINSVKSITLNRSVINITKGKKGILSAKIKYSGKNNLKKESVVWTSKNSKIATVSSKGTIKAVNIGKTYIICSSKSGLVKARCKVVVREPYNSVKSIRLDKSQIRLNKGDKRTLTPTITYGNKKNYSNESIVWKSSNNKIASVDKNGTVKGKSNGTAYITIKSKFTNKSAKCKVIVQKTKYVAFTFDDGPGIYTDKLLDSLEKYHSQATFFVLGNRVNSYKSELKREFELGMEIGSHTYSHKNLKTLSKSEISSEISKASKAIENIIGEKPSLLRPPYGNYNQTVSKKAGAPMIYWSVDTLDWKYKKTNYVCNTILKQAKDSDIILLHDIHETSVNGFIKALPTLRKKGYELVTVSELYKIKGKELKKGVMYYGPKKDN